MTQALLPLEHDLSQILEDEIPLEVPFEEGPLPANIAARMESIRDDLLIKTGGLANFTKEVGKIIRDAVDYAIDAPTLYRVSIDDLEPDEKTAVGKRIERMFRFKFGIPRGKSLDIELSGEDVDIKTTMSNKWMFSKSSWNHFNLLIAYNESKAQFSAGLVFVIEEQLGAKNRDTKRTIKKKYYEKITWIVENSSYPPNFLAFLAPDLLNQITSLPTPNERVNALLAMVQETIIPRHAICSVANQVDPLKRLRRNGGARETLWTSGILVLSGTSKSDKAIAQKVLGFSLMNGEFASLSINTPSLSKAMLNSYASEHGHDGADRH